MGADLTIITTEHLKELIDAIEDKLDNDTHGLEAIYEAIVTETYRLFGNMAGSFSNKNPLVEFIAGKDSAGTRNPVGKSWRDIIGTGYLDAGGGFGTDNVAADLLAIKASTDTGIFHEQVDTAVSITAIAASETTVLDLSVADTRYIVRSLRLKAADPSTETITVRLYELINDVLTVIDTFDIDTANFGTYHSLMDMFGIPHLAGDSLKVTVQVSGGAGVAVTGQYSHGKTNV